MQMKTEWFSKPSKTDQTYFALPLRLKIGSVERAILFSISHSCKPLISSESQLALARGLMKDQVEHKTSCLSCYLI